MDKAPGFPQMLTKKALILNSKLPKFGKNSPDFAQSSMLHSSKFQHISIYPVPALLHLHSVSLRLMCLSTKEIILGLVKLRGPLSC